MIALLPLPEPQTRIKFEVFCVRVSRYPLLRPDVSVVENCLLISDAVEVEKQVVQKGNGDVSTVLFLNFVFIYPLLGQRLHTKINVIGRSGSSSC